MQVLSSWTLACKCACAGYAFTFAPNQTPFRDQLFLEKLVGINPSSTVDVGVVFFNLFNIMGKALQKVDLFNTISEALQKAACVDHSLALVTRSASPKRHMVSIHAGVYPALYAAMLLPAAKSRNNVSTAVRQLFDTVPVATQRPLNGLSTVCSSQLMCTLQIPTAPFVVASFGVGMFSLLPYFALWSPLPREERTLPPKSELVSTTAFQACVPPCEQIVHVFHMYRDLAQPSLGLQAVGDH